MDLSSNKRIEKMAALTKLNPWFMIHDSCIIPWNSFWKQRGKDSGISCDVTYHILKKKNKFRTESVRQVLERDGSQQRLAFCNSIKIASDFQDKILFSDNYFRFVPTNVYKSDKFVDIWIYFYWSQVNLHWLKKMDHQRIWKVILFYFKKIYAMIDI